METLAKRQIFLDVDKDFNLYFFPLIICIYIYIYIRDGRCLSQENRLFSTTRSNCLTPFR